MSNRRRKLSTYHIVALLIILLAFALRVYRLSHRSLWFDEAIEYWVASAPVSEIIPSVKTAMHDPPVYSFLLHYWMNLGRHEFSLRFLSVVFSIFGILGTMTLGKLTLGRGVGLAAGLLVALATPDIRFAQEVGQYAIVVGVLSWNLVFLYLAVTRGAPKWFGLWAITSVVALYIFFGAGIIVGATALATLAFNVLRREWSVLKKLIVAGAVCGLLVLPLVVTWLPDKLFTGPGDPASQFSVASNRIELDQFLQRSKNLFLFQAMGYQPRGWPWSYIQKWMIWLPFVGMLFLGFFQSKSQRHLPAWLLVCYLAFYVLGRMGAYPFGGFEGRYSVIITPLLWIVFAAGIVNLRRFSAIVAFLPLGLMILVFAFTPTEPQEDLRSITQFWLDNRRHDDVTYVYYGAAPGFRYQLDLVEGREQIPPLWYRMCWVGDSSPACERNGMFFGRWIRALPPDEQRELVLETIGFFPDRLWMIFSHVYSEEDKVIVASLKDSYSTVLNHRGENASAYLLERH